MRRRLTVKELNKYFTVNVKTGSMKWRVNKSPAKAGDYAGNLNSDGRYLVQVNGRTYKRAHLVWLFVTGKWPKGDLDHINGRPSIDRISNLREATRSQNLYNAKIRSNNASGFKGVHFYKQRGKWQAQIRVNRKCISLGLFPTPEAAHAAYQRAALKYAGEFARFE